MFNYIQNGIRKEQRKLDNILYSNEITSIRNLIFYGIWTPILEEFCYRNNWFPSSTSDLYPQPQSTCLPSEQKTFYQALNDSDLLRGFTWLMMHVIGEVAVEESNRIIRKRFIQRTFLLVMILLGNSLFGHLWPGILVHVLWNCSVTLIQNYRRRQWNALTKEQRGRICSKQLLVQLNNPFASTKTEDDVVHYMRSRNTKYRNKRYTKIEIGSNRAYLHQFIQWPRKSITVD